MAESQNLSGWQPIETAPNDGTEFLALSVYRLTANGKFCMWHAIVLACGNAWPSSACDGEPLWDATHWMPLPSPPSE